MWEFQICRWKELTNFDTVILKSIYNGNLYTLNRTNNAV